MPKQFTFELSDELIGKLDKMKRLMGGQPKDLDVFIDALAVYEYLLEHRDKGNTIVLRKPEGDQDISGLINRS